MNFCWNPPYSYSMGKQNWLVLFYLNPSILLPHTVVFVVYGCPLPTVYDIETSTYQEGDHNPCCSKKLAGKLIFGAPFFLFTLIFRAVSIALIICFLQMWSGVIIFGLFFINVLTALFIGDDFHRSCIYALWSMFVPVGYSRYRYFLFDNS